MRTNRYCDACSNAGETTWIRPNQESYLIGYVPDPQLWKVCPLCANHARDCDEFVMSYDELTKIHESLRTIGMVMSTREIVRSATDVFDSEREAEMLKMGVAL